MAEWDLPNWATMIVEIIVVGFAVGISIFFYKREKKARTDSDQVIKKLEKKSDEEEKQKKNNIKTSIEWISIELENIKHLAEGLYTPEIGSPEDPLGWKKEAHKSLPRQANNLRDYLTIFPITVLSDKIIQILNRILLDCSILEKPKNEWDYGPEYLIKRIDKAFEMISEYKKQFS